MIYADNAATTKMSKAAIDVMCTLTNSCWGNPSSLYTHGQKAKEVLEKAREEVASVIGAGAREIIFTSGGSEADNQAILSAAAIGKRKGKLHIVSTAFEHHAVLHTLEKLKKEKIESLVVDLRGNGGGLITEAAGFTGLFIEKGPVVQVRDMNNFIETVDDPSSDIMYDGPMVVLIDNLSASASEIFAAALQDYGRALIVGSNSFGKGTVQQVRSLSKFYDLFNGELGQLSYTIAKFYRINGGSTQLRGVTPDVVMPMISDVQKYSEKELDNALPWDSIKSQKFQRVGSPAEHAQKLSIELNARIASDPAYQVTLEQIELAKKIVDKPSVSLNLEERKTKKEEDAKGELDRTNRLLKIIGQKPVENLNDVPADVKFPDPIKDQAARVALGLALQQ